jgi:FkbM family methyltransferase
MIYFDIGANEGHWCVDIAKNNPHIQIYAFEPVPQLYNTLIEKTSHLKNIEIVNKAIDLQSGKRVFNISKESWYGNHGCSSFLTFSERSKTEWVGRDDFQVIETIEVDTISLEEFVNEKGIEIIDYIKIDTQGWDVNVLKSLGDKISIIKEGELEAGAKNDILYVGQNTELESVSFLLNNNFRIIKIEPNDIHHNEVNIKFKINED